MPQTQTQHYVVPPDQAGVRLDRWLAERLEMSRAQIKRLLESGAVTVDGRTIGRAGKGDPLTGGQRVAVDGFERPEHQTPIANPDLALTELTQGDGWVIVDKSAGIAVHPLEPGEDDTVLNAVATRHPEIVGVGEAGLRSGVVHRLDLGTTGTLLFALNQTTWERFREAFREHRTRKVYRAIVAGQVHVGDAITLSLEVAQHKPAKVRVTGGEGRLCDLAYRPLEIFPDATLLEVELGTGFLHQIRVTMAYLGHPVLGDTHYAPQTPHASPEPSAPSRPMLHAYSLACEEANATCEPPVDFLHTTRVLREGS